MIVEYVLRELERKFPGGWLGSRRGPEKGGAGAVDALEEIGIPASARMRERLRNTPDLAALLETFALKSIRLDSHLGLLGWLTRDYPLILRRDIPTPREMLDIQCEGQRFVSLLDEDRAVGRHSGRLEFLLHDLEHAHKFFGDPFSRRAQIRFFLFLRENLSRFDRWLGDDRFRADLDYLMSDMNSHPAHLFKFLKAIVLTAELREDGRRHASLDEFWTETLKGWPADRRAAALRVNHPGVEKREDLLSVSEFFAF